MTHRIRNTDELEEILAKGENESIEFKAAVPRPEIIARNIGALSNTSGGTVLIGVNNDGSIIGSDIQTVRKALEKAQANLTPQPATEVYEVPYQDKRIVAIDVLPSSTGPVLSGGNALMRVGPRTAPITPQKVVSFFDVEDRRPADIMTKVEILARTIGKQSETIESLRRELEKRDKWRNKLKDWIWSGLVGAVIGLLFAALLRIG